MNKIILIVGASGVGKDTLLQSVKNSLDGNFVKRYITRVADENESNFYLDNDAFEILKKDGFFISSWDAHGNHYAIAKNQIKNGLNIISISRGAVQDFEKIYDNVITIEITLPKEVLYLRLKNRGRENEEQIQTRLARSYQKIKARKLIHFDNSRSLTESSQAFIQLLHNLKHAR